MSYRSFKRVLGETNLERKCLILFAACLFLLITGAFWYAERNAERLVEETTRKTGQGWVTFMLLKQHILEHVSSPGGKQQSHYEMMSEMDRDFSSENYEWEILIRDGSKTIEENFNWTRPPANDRERRIMDDIEQRLVEQIRSLPLDDAADDLTAELRPVPDAESVAATAQPVTPTDPRDRALASDVDGKSALDEARVDAAGPSLERVSYLDSRKNEYHYYEAVYWTERCIVCHIANEGVFVSRSQEPRSELRGPLRVVKVTLPNDEAQAATIRSRSMLLATAIITVFLSVITLYLVVRYVIVKPLNHLRYVSDEISRGRTNLRAEIQTNDEFEDLAASFNRMLRHLIDTQEELQKVNEDLDGKLDQLAQANMQLHEMNQLKSDFLATMSHELRTPLNSIIGFSDVLKGIDTLNDKQQRYVDNIGSSGRVLLEMINEILDLAKMESGKMEVRLTEFSMAPVVKAQCDLVRALTEEKNIDLEVRIESDMRMLYQDQAKVQQILTNLLSNAIKFTPEGGRIIVSAKPEMDGFFALSVEDTGVGIAEEDHQIIFEKFRQGSTVMGSDNLTRKFSGTGLGLSIVRELCRLLGGDIYFGSELGKGSVFTARLPWRRTEQPNLQSSLTARLDEMTKSQRADQFRGSHGPVQQSDVSVDSTPTVPSPSRG